MAIERIKRATLLCPISCSQRLLRGFHGLAALELTDAFEQLGDTADAFGRQSVSTEEHDRQLHRIHFVRGLLDTHFPEKKSFVAGLAPVPLVVRSEELDAAQHFDLDTVHAAASELDGEFRHNEHMLGEIQGQIRELQPWAGFPNNVSDLHHTKRVTLLLGVLPAGRLNELSASESGTIIAWERVGAGVEHRHSSDGTVSPPAASFKEKPNTLVRMVVAFASSDTDGARKVLARAGFEEFERPKFSGKIRDHIRELQGSLADYQARQLQVLKKIEGLLVHRRALDVAAALWDDRKRLVLAQTQSAQGRWMHVYTGYIRECDVDRVETLIRNEFTGVSCVWSDPAPDEDVPVSIALSPAIRPIQMLINLFGLPVYKSFDPSPFIFVPFLAFFGICFSDVAYGLLLIAMSVYIMRRTRIYPGIYNFAKLLLYGGLSTVVFGAMFGSFLGDLYSAKYLGENNPLLIIMDSVRIIDPLEKPMVVLVCALLIGMLNQLYGVGLKMYGAVLQRNYTEAICDGLFWLIILPGFAILASGMFAPVPALLTRLGLAMFALGAAGLVLTQGRDSETLGGKIVTGVVSLYGIVGSYGVTAFIGDTMSYCRLLALALTTGIVAMSFNMIADMLRVVPYVGDLLFIAVLVLAHGFNFLISVLGAFIHAMRLVFVEFFGRFYDSGAREFAPLGFDSDSAIMRKTP